MSPVEAWASIAVFLGLAFGVVSLRNIQLRDRFDVLSKQVEVYRTTQKCRQSEEDEPLVPRYHPESDTHRSHKYEE